MSQGDDFPWDDLDAAIAVPWRQLPSKARMKSLMLAEQTAQGRYQDETFFQSPCKLSCLLVMNITLVTPVAQMHLTSLDNTDVSFFETQRYGVYT